MKKIRVHYSFDDVLWIFKDLTEHEKEYNTIFENSLLFWMREMHLKYGVAFDLYVFYNAWYNFTLSDTTDKYAFEFKENAEWLRVGFHGFGFTSNGTDREYGGDMQSQLIADYDLVTHQLQRIAAKENISDMLRLSFFSGNKKGMRALRRKYGVKVFFCADKSNKRSYYLSERQCKKLEEKGCLHDWIRDIWFYKTTVRIEEEKDIGTRLYELGNRNMPVIVFCHEWAFLEKPNLCKKKFEECFEYLDNK